MNTRRSPNLLTVTALAASLMLTACGGGSGEAPPAGVSAPVDTTGPVVTITDSVVEATATGPVTFSFGFNKDVGTSFTVDDIMVTGGTKGAFTRVNGTSATLVVTPTPNSTGTIIVSVAAGAALDAKGNGSAASSSQQLFDTVLRTQMSLPVSFDTAGVGYGLTGFGGAEDSSIVVDPTNAANKVAKVVRAAGAETYAGTTITDIRGGVQTGLSPKIPFNATDTRMSVRVWSPDAGIPVRLKVEDSADPNKSVETEATVTTAAGWQTLTFDFKTQSAGTAALNLGFNYNKATIFFDFGRAKAAAVAKTYYFDDLAFVPGAAAGGGGGAATTTTITMDETTPPALTGFGGAEDSTVVVDPTNAANKVAKVVKSATAELWAGTTVSNLANQAIAPIGFSAGNTTITVRVWSPTAGTPVRLKVESATDPTKSVETEATTTVANGWQTLSFNFANQAAGTAALNLATTYNKASIFFNFGTTGAAAGGARTYYFDDVTYPAAGSTGGGSGGGTSNFPAITFSAAGTTYTLTGFGGAEDATVAVDPTGGTNMVAKVVKSATAELWAGTTVSTGANQSIAQVPFTATARSMSMRVYAPAVGIPVRLKLEDAADVTKTVETEALTTAANTWLTLTFNFANQAPGTAALNLATNYNKASVFFNFGKTGAQGGGGTYYFDDLNFVP